MIEKSCNNCLKSLIGCKDLNCNLKSWIPDYFTMQQINKSLEGAIEEISKTNQYLNEQLDLTKEALMVLASCLGIKGCPNSGIYSIEKYDCNRHCEEEDVVYCQCCWIDYAITKAKEIKNE